MEMNPAGAAWRKSSYSGAAQNCVEVAGDPPGAVGVRDSKDPDGPALVFTPGAWRTFAGQVRNGELGLSSPAAVPA
jgi:Domain of unknown function (DUF397)